MSQVLRFPPRIRSWRRDDPKAEPINIGNRGSILVRLVENVTVVELTPAAPDAHRFERFVPATCSGPNLAPKWWYYHCWEDDSDVAFSSYEFRAWKARAHKPRKQWARHARRIPTLDLSVRADDQADIAAK